jgi:hypothetical protein
VFAGSSFFISDPDRRCLCLKKAQFHL